MIAFINPGCLDIRTLKIFGVSVKTNENPIGRFGSGAKVALAILMRLKHKVTIWIGRAAYTVTTKRITIRCKDFDHVVLIGPNGEEHELPFNTHTGFEWEDWTPYRELASNALDEGGHTTALAEYAPRDDQTAIVVEGTEIERAHTLRDSIFLRRADPILTTNRIEVYRGESTYAFYRGVRVARLKVSSLFTYNLIETLAGLTEDRTLKDVTDVDFEVCRALAEHADAEVLRQALIAPDTAFEHHMMAYSFTPSPTFVQTYTELRQAGHMSSLSRAADAIYVKGKGSLPLPPPIQPTPVQAKQLAKAIDFCKRHGAMVDQHPITVVPHAHGGLLALAEGGRIVLTTDLFERGTKKLAHALFEEHIHLTTGYGDCTRELQTLLFERLMSAWETIDGEPV